MNSYKHPETLVSTQWLADHLSDSNVRIVEVDMDPQTYQNAHIPGAIFWHIFTDLLNPDFSQKLNAQDLSKLLSRSGITPETIVIPYGSPGTSGWIFWLLQVAGHKNVRVLNGEHQKWVSENRPVSSDFAQYPETPYSIDALNHSSRAYRTDVQADLEKADSEKSDQILVDVRTQAEYSGEFFFNKPPEEHERAGHIPTAVHLDQALTMNSDGTLKSFDDLKALYSRHNITPDKAVITYCAIGARAGYIWFVLTYLLGYPNVKNYDGSWVEWIQQAGAAIATG